MHCWCPEPWGLIQQFYAIGQAGMEGIYIHAGRDRGSRDKNTQLIYDIKALQDVFIFIVSNPKTKQDTAKLRRERIGKRYSPR